MQSTRRPFFVLTAGALILAACSGAALAQNAKPADQAPSKQDALKGPKVKESGVPGENRRFAGGDQKRKDQMGSTIPHPLFVRAIDTLKGDNAAAGVRLSDAQVTQLDEIDAEFKTSMTKFREDHREELLALRDQLPENARRRINAVLGGGDRPEGRPNKKGQPPAKRDDARPMDSDRPMEADSPDAAQAMALVKELLEQAPKAEDTHTKMWAVLNTAQKAQAQQAIERLKNEAESRRGKPNAKDGKGDASKGKNGQPAFDPNNLPPQMQERLKNMTPEQREQAIKRLQERQKKQADKD